ncbi:MAG: FAD binding domain-containing protein [Hyphomicrobiaceae bacterium]
MRYEAPRSLDAAIALLGSSEGSTKILAGGTDLLVQLRTDMIEPDLVVDIKKIDETRSIVETADGFVVGAAVSAAELNEHEGFAAAWPGVAEAAWLIGSTQIMGRASLGGNLCNGSPAADSVPAMIAAGATANVASRQGLRQVRVEDVMVGPRKLSIGPDEFIVSFRFPARPHRSGDAYQRFIPRTEMDIAVVGCGVNVIVAPDGTIADARVALGAVAERPLLVPAAADAIIGTSLDEEALAALDAAARAACRPIDDKRGTRQFRVQVAGVLARRVAELAYDRAGS